MRSLRIPVAPTAAERLTCPTLDRVAHATVSAGINAIRGCGTMRVLMPLPSAVQEGLKGVSERVSVQLINRVWTCAGVARGRGASDRISASSAATAWLDA